jgi:bifunctional non-homologous end joining protein LigD
MGRQADPEGAAITRSRLNGLCVTAPDLPIQEQHLYRCTACGLLVDRRDLGDVLHHEEPGHEPSGPLVGLRFVEPMLATLAAEAPEGEEWIHEIKYDGYRTQIVIDGGDVRAFTRNGHDWTDRYRGVLRAAGELKCDSAILDGEMIVQDEQGRSDFAAFKHALRWEPHRLMLMGFDLLHLDGEDLRPMPLLDRRERLQELVGCHDPGCCIQYSEHVVKGGSTLFEAADAMGLEGIVSKKASSRYRSGRSRSWLKVKCFGEGAFVVLGVNRGEGRPATALLAQRTVTGLEYAGGAAITLAGREREEFWRSVDRLAAEAPAIAMAKDAQAVWLRPELMVRSRYLKGSDKLRHATLCGLISMGAPVLGL